MLFQIEIIGMFLSSEILAFSMLIKADLHLAARTVRLAFTSLQFDWIISDVRRAAALRVQPGSTFKAYKV